MSFHRKIMTGAALIVSLSPAVAMAQEKFGGPYFGGHAGHVWGDDSGTEIDSIEGPTGWIQNANPEGVAYGLFLGHNLMVSRNMLLGVSADIEARSQHADFFQIDPYTGLEDRCCSGETDVKAAALVRGRLGFLLDENRNTLAYATFGLALARIKTSFLHYEGNPPVQSSAAWDRGWTFGGGVERMVSRSASFKLEYSYSDYGVRDVVCDAVFFEDCIERQDYDEHVTRLGLAYHFGGR